MSRIPAILSVILLSGPLPAQESPKPFVTYPGPVGDYLKRIQQGRQAHSFDASVRFGQWQEKARGALIELTGLEQIGKDLGGMTFVIVRPDRFVYAACQTAEDLHLICSGIREKIGLE